MILNERDRYYGHLDNWDWMWNADFPNAFWESLDFGSEEMYRRRIYDPVLRRRHKDFPNGNPYKTVDGKHTGMLR